MGKISAIDKIWMQTSREHESWRESHNRGMETEHSEEICRCDQLCQRIGKLALAVDNRRVFVRWKPSKMWVSWLIRSQEGQSRTHLSTRQVAAESSVINTVNLELFGHQITNDAVWQKRLERIESLLRRLNPRQTKQVFTDEKIFISSHPSASRTAASGQRGRKWTSLLPSDRLLIEREKFAQHVMVSAGMCWGRQGQVALCRQKGKCQYIQ